MRFADVRVLYTRELRAAFRERSIVVNSVLLPILLYPFLLWLVFSGITVVTGLSEAAVSRVALDGLPPVHGALLDSLRAAPRIRVVDPPGDPDEARRAVREGDLDAWLQVVPPEPEGAPLSDNFAVRIAWDRAVDRSRTARVRVESVLDAYRDGWVERSADALGLGPEERVPFRVETANVATEEEMGALLLGMMVPLFLVVMVALGCFVPAIDATAGERERSTWETLMTVAASRTSIVTAKYLYVATLGMAAGVLNVGAVTVSLGPIVGRLGGDAAEALDLSFPLLAVPVMVLGAALLALFFAAAMMILASFARTFKDGQSMVTPVYWLALLPLLIGNAPDAGLTPAMAAVPVANVALMIKDAIRGVFTWPLIAATLGVGLVQVALCLWAARAVLRFEDLLLGSWDGSFWTFVRERWLRGRPRSPAASPPARGGER